MKKNTKLLLSASFLLTVFVIWTYLVSVVDLQNIGPNDSVVGFGTVNRYIKDIIGVNFTLYIITDWLGLVPVAICLSFAMLGLVQWIKRKSLKKVDASLFVLGTFYIIVIFAYLLFEYLVINYRPVLINGYLEPSYPSSTTLLVACVMPTTVIQLRRRIKNRTARKIVLFSIRIFTIFTVFGRLLSGVHWFSDIVGGLMLSAGLVTAYAWGESVLDK